VIPVAEVGNWAATFGVPSIQVERDHFISHLLSVIAEIGELRFFGVLHSVGPICAARASRRTLIS
jgi:hypothetical protein